MSDYGNDFVTMWVKFYWYGSGWSCSVMDRPFTGDRPEDGWYRVRIPVPKELARPIIDADLEAKP